MSLSISDKGLAIIKKYEGLVLTAYKCPAGIWTIGYGHTLGVKPGMRITKAEAVEYLKSDCKGAERAVNNYDSLYNWTQNQFDALVSFTFNCGAGNLDTLLDGGRRTIAEISEKIVLYNKANGQTLEGLVRRRAEEKALFDAASNKSTTKTQTTTKKEVCEVKLNVLGKGDKGNDVKALQILLIGNGYDCGGFGADGDFGAGTEKSVKAYQKKKGLTADGIVGEKTWGKLLR